MIAYPSLRNNTNLNSVIKNNREGTTEHTRKRKDRTNYFGVMLNGMDGWMDGWMDGRMDGWMESSVDAPSCMIHEAFTAEITALCSPSHSSSSRMMN